MLFFLRIKSYWILKQKISWHFLNILNFKILFLKASVGSKISIEKDWVIVIANKDVERLTKINSIFRTIDLICLLLAPLIIGLKITIKSII